MAKLDEPKSEPKRKKLRAPSVAMAGDEHGGETALLYLMAAIAIGAFVAHLLSRVAP